MTFVRILIRRIDIVRNFVARNLFRIKQNGIKNCFS